MQLWDDVSSRDASRILPALAQLHANRQKLGTMRVEQALVIFNATQQLVAPSLPASLPLLARWAVQRQQQPGAKLQQGDPGLELLQSITEWLIGLLQLPTASGHPGCMDLPVDALSASVLFLGAASNGCHSEAQRKIAAACICDVLAWRGADLLYSELLEDLTAGVAMSVADLMDDIEQSSWVLSSFLQIFRPLRVISLPSPPVAMPEPWRLLLPPNTFPDALDHHLYSCAVHAASLGRQLGMSTLQRYSRAVPPVSASQGGMPMLPIRTLLAWSQLLRVGLPAQGAGGFPSANTPVDAANHPLLAAASLLLATGLLEGLLGGLQQLGHTQLQQQAQETLQPVLLVLSSCIQAGLAQASCQSVEASHMAAASHLEGDVDTSLPSCSNLLIWAAGWSYARLSAGGLSAALSLPVLPHGAAAQLLPILAVRALFDAALTLGPVLYRAALHSLAGSSPPAAAHDDNRPLHLSSIPSWLEAHCSDHSSPYGDVPLLARCVIDAIRQSTASPPQAPQHSTPTSTHMLSSILRTLRECSASFNACYAALLLVSPPDWVQALGPSQALLSDILQKAYVCAVSICQALTDAWPPIPTHCRDLEQLARVSGLVTSSLDPLLQQVGGASEAGSNLARASGPASRLSSSPLAEAHNRPPSLTVVASLDAHRAAALMLGVLGSVNFCRVDALPLSSQLPKHLATLVAESPSACSLLPSELPSYRMLLRALPSAPLLRWQSDVVTLSWLQFLLPMVTVCAPRAQDPIAASSQLLPFMFLFLAHRQDSVALAAHSCFGSLLASMSEKGHVDMVCQAVPAYLNRTLPCSHSAPSSHSSHGSHDRNVACTTATPCNDMHAVPGVSAMFGLRCPGAGCCVRGMSPGQAEGLSVSLPLVLSSLPPESNTLAMACVGRLVSAVRCWMSGLQESGTEAPCHAPAPWGLDFSPLYQKQQQHASGQLPPTGSMAAVQVKLNPGSQLAALAVSLMFVCDCSMLPAVAEAVSALVAPPVPRSARAHLMQQIHDVVLGSDDYVRKAHMPNWFHGSLLKAETERVVKGGQEMQISYL